MKQRSLWRTSAAIAYHTTKNTVRRLIIEQPKIMLGNKGLCSKPQFLIIGAQKCGTTSLHYYLCEHPDVFRGCKKEIEYFSNDEKYNVKNSAYYHSQFPLPNKLPRNGVVFEASPEYIYNPKCAARIFNYNPDIKLILILRNPVDRAFSAWNFYRRMHGRITPSTFKLRLRKANSTIKTLLREKQYPSFEELIDKEIEKINSGTNLLLTGIIQRGMYAEQIKKYLKFFDEAQILIFDNSELRTRPKKVLNQISNFVGLRSFDWSWHENRRKHVGTYNTSLKSGTRSYLSDFFAPYNEELYRLLDRDFGW
jgi:hypothetical protein